MFIAPERNRIPNLRFRRPTPENSNDSKNKDLQQVELGAYKPAYKNFSKTADGQPFDLPVDLAEVVEVWPDLPIHINAVIKALIQSHTRGIE